MGDFKPFYAEEGMFTKMLMSVYALALWSSI